MGRVRNGAVEIHYEEVGEGPPVVFVHGWAMSWELWDRQLGALADAHRCIAVDLRGHGWSSKPLHAYAYGDHVADLTALADELGLEHFSLVGSSFGGAVGIELAAALPGRLGKVCVVGTPPKVTAGADWPAGRPEADARQLLELQQKAREKTMWRVVEDSLYSELGHAVLQWLFGLALRSPTWAAVGSYEGVLEADVRPAIEKLAAELLVVQGAHDPFVSSEAATWMAGHAPLGRLEWFERSAHFPFLEEPDRFNELLRQFLAAGS